MPEPESYDPHISMRVDKDLWAQFGASAGPRNRAVVLRDFIRWWLRQPGAKLPARPP